MKFGFVMPAAFVALAILAWINFWLLPPDGLANLGLMLVVLPVTLLDLALRAENNASVLIPDRFGYYGDHAVFFGLSALAIAIVLWGLGSFLDRRRAARKSTHLRPDENSSSSSRPGR